MGIAQIEYAAEVAMEHNLGLTCDPIGDLVQIPCIERNAVAAMRAINALSLANFLADSSKISFDVAVDTMYETGNDSSIIIRKPLKGAWQTTAKIPCIRPKIYLFSSPMHHKTTFIKLDKKKTLRQNHRVNGAGCENRTRHLIITSDVLYRMS